MKYKERMGHSQKSKMRGMPRRLIYLILILAVLASIYLSFAWHRYQDMARMEAKQLAQSVSSLLHVEHIMALGEGDAASDEELVEQSLSYLVEVTDSIYYAYLLKEKNGDIKIVVDSSTADSATSSPTSRSCEEAIGTNSEVFASGEGIVTGPITTPCGEWIRTLVPIFDMDGREVIAVLGISYSAMEWKNNLWTKMIPDFIVTISILALIYTIYRLLLQNERYKHAEESRQESERSKSVFFSHIPGMAYRCKDNHNYTMEFVSEGCYDLTGYQPEDLIGDREISYYQIISPEFRELVRAEWKKVLMEGKDYRDEYEIITKSGERKWVLELAQGIYDNEGKVEALEGIVLDISEQKKLDHQITYLKERDFLTGLYNRHYIEKEKKRLDKPEFLPLSILVCDIDGLRVINDAYGHNEGDYLIAKTAQLLKNHLREEDRLGYIGGGEFMILLPKTDSQAADQVEMEIKNSMDSFNRVNKRNLYNISLTIGNSTKEREDQAIQAVHLEAEENLRRRKILNQNSSHSAILSSIMATLYAKSQETEEHGQRLGEFCMMIGEYLGLSHSELDELRLLSQLHDIGKIGIEDQILNKPGSLTEEEWEIMKKHPEIGHRIAMTTPQLSHIAEYILNHHERWDGTGYPRGLKGKEIPLAARILAVSDAYDAMTQDRIYRKALSKEAALKEIEDNAGTQFDPVIARLFVDLIRNQDMTYQPTS
jgi:diguanylate cyclase (GGDEF)-like protein/PAS domain S-box-containing protein